ncbi:MAG: hypothetical protein OXH72_07780 [Caldilineaceae bacterium]|nr:hypothetical protein [Caldilineaceae bacterium]
MKNNTVATDKTAHRTVHMQSVGTPADDDPERRCRTLNEVVEEIRARNRGFSAADNLPREMLYDRDRARREVREANSVDNHWTNR